MVVPHFAKNHKRNFWIYFRINVSRGDNHPNKWNICLSKDTLVTFAADEVLALKRTLFSSTMLLICERNEALFSHLASH